MAGGGTIDRLNSYEEFRLPSTKGHIGEKPMVKIVQRL